MIYVDTAYRLKCFLNEPNAHLVRAVVRQAGSIASSAHGRAEFWSGVQRHVREGRLSAADASQVFRALEAEEKAAAVCWLPMEQPILNRACAIIEQHAATLPMRSGDVLHLACALEHGFEAIHTNDRHLLAVAEVVGIQAINVLP